MSRYKFTITAIGSVIAENAHDAQSKIEADMPDLTHLGSPSFSDDKRTMEQRTEMTIKIEPYPQS
jgi:hypothetical protein